jgi:hypothetical protein
MVSKATIKYYGEVIEDYFEYIVESIINGQRQQVRKLIKNLSKEQKKEALVWYDEQIITFCTDSYKEAKEIVIELL